MNPGEKWKAYYSHLGEFPSENELDVIKGIVVTGSFRGANDDLDFVI